MTTPAAPVTLVTTPSGNTLDSAPRTAVEVATTAARAEMAARAAAPAAPVVPAVAGQPRVEAGVPEGGQFAPRPGEVAPQAGLPAGTEAKPVDGTQPPPVAPVAPPANETPEQKTAREAAEALAATVDPLLIALPGRNAGEEFEIKVDSPEAAERLAQLRNGFMRGEEVRVARGEIMERAQAIANREMEIQLDPTGFLESAVGDVPELVDHVVLATLTRDDATWNRLKPILQAMLADPKELRTVRAEQKAARSDIREQMAEETRHATTVRENLQDVQATVASFLPAEMPQAQQRLLYEDCLRDLKGHADRYRLRTIPVHDIPTILASRLTAYGINPVEAAAAIAASAARRGPAARPAAGNPPAAPRTPAARPAAPPPNGQRFVASAVKKAAVGSIPAPGAGSPTNTGITPPVKADGTKMGIEEAIAFRRSQLATRTT